MMEDLATTEISTFESVLTANKVAPQLQDIFQAALDITFVTGKNVLDVLSDRKFLQKHIENITFSVGTKFSIQCTKVLSEYCHNTEHINGIKYENSRRTVSIIFDYINTRLLLFSDLNARSENNELHQSTEYTLQLSSLKSAKQELIDDIVDLVKMDKADLLESCISVFTDHILIHIDGLSITIRPRILPTDEHCIAVNTYGNHFVNSDNVYLYSFISALTASIDRIADSFEHCKRLRDQLAVLFPTCIDVQSTTTINDAIQQFIRSNETVLLYELKQFQSYAKRYFRIEKISSKSYTIEAYEEFADGKKYWSFHKRLTGVNRDILDFMNLANTVYNVFNV